MIMKTTSIQKSISIFSITLYALAFCIPFFFSAQQLITGTIINCLLFLSATRLSKKEVLPIVALPSIATLLHGVLFGPQTVFLFYFLPFVWLGNYALVHVFVSSESKPYWLRIALSSAAKYLLLQACAQLYYNCGIVPSVFLVSMGYIQLITALVGGALAYGVGKIISYERR